MGFTFEQWCLVTTIGLSVVAIVIAILSSRQTSRDTHKQIVSINDLSQLQLEATLLLIEEELFRTTTEYRKVELQAKIDAEEHTRNISCVGAMVSSRNAYEQQYAPILQGYQARIDKLQRIINKLKCKKI